MRNHRDDVLAYAEQVLAGAIPASQIIRQACERHIRDLEEADKRGIYFDRDAAHHAIDFFQFLRHSKGEWGGQTFELQPWQRFIVGSLFGWKRAEDGTRRYRTAYIEVPRKNGKSTMLAGIGLYLFICDGEPGAEIYTAATKRDQARITHSEATRMVKASPALRKRVKIFKDNLHIEATHSKFEPLGADADTMDGLNVHAALVDELHAHKSSAVWDVLDTATAARRQPLMIAITTAGFDQTSFCYEMHSYAKEILAGTVQDDTFFAYIAAPDEGDDPFDEATWWKANPNLGVSKKVDDMRRLAERAKVIPSQLNNFLTKHLNVWTQQAQRWIPLDLWDTNGGEVDEEKLRGRLCFGGLDLSSVSDITAWVMVFPHDDDPERIDVLARFFVPEARLTDPHNRYAAQYQAWARQGYLFPTPGDAVDYEFVKAQILKDAQTFRLVDMAIDRLFQGHQLAVQLLDEGLTVVGMGMGFTSMAAPMKEFERRLRIRKINHGRNPVLRWMANNVSVKMDPAGNIKPDKATSQGKIDGIVALIMALDRAMRHTKPKASVYERRGVLTL